MGRERVLRRLVGGVEHVGVQLLLERRRELVVALEGRLELGIPEAVREDFGDVGRGGVRPREDLLVDRERRLEETKRQIEAETHRALQQIRSEVAELTLIATTKVTGKVLDDADHKRLIDEAIRDLDFSVLEETTR